MINSAAQVGASFSGLSPKVGQATGQLGKQDFLQLLVAQIRHQDPLKPMEDKEFIAELGQFSSLEETQKINANLSALLVGLEATAKDATGREITGVIEGVYLNGTSPLLAVAGEKVAVADLLEVRLNPRR
ncbi:MAG: flagellar hook capping protein [Firmicutes bacterium]|nr:flagellar hook capping protein [Bacillota bacterium]MCL5039519.1 flagellar hook capping protein [Bacillota bacterium]